MVPTVLDTTTISAVDTRIAAVPGFRAAAVSAGIRKSGRLDMALIAADGPCAAAGVFTTNCVRAAPVLLDIAHLKQNPAGIRAVVVNSGVANACTGQRGVEDAAETARLVAGALGCAAQDVFVMSTGVIGVTLPMEKIGAGVGMLAAGLEPDGWAGASRAIMTTDTMTKTAAVRVTTPGGVYTVAGIAKGSGMIAPYMATMLAVIATDAAIDAPGLQTALSAANGVSFNQIVVDGDMSTNDTVIALASGASGVNVQTGADREAFGAALTAVCTALARDIVLDGEGVTKFITLHVTGAPDAASARQVAMTIATSPLVKTAFFGCDANWGRILAAAGRAGVAVDPDRLDLWFAAGEAPEDAGLQLVASGTPTDYREQDAAAIMQEKAITVRLDLGLGDAVSTVWTCDLSHDYVSINGDYRS